MQNPYEPPQSDLPARRGWRNRDLLRDGWLGISFAVAASGALLAARGPAWSLIESLVFSAVSTMLAGLIICWRERGNADVRRWKVKAVAWFGFSFSICYILIKLAGGIKLVI